MGMLICDEAGHSPTPETMAELMLTLRLKPMRAVLAANPGGKEHGNIVRRWLQHPDWKPFRDQAGLLWVNCPSTSKDNPHIDPVAYKKMFQAMRGMDPGRADAMEFGSWRLHGDFFAAWGPHLVYDHTEMPPDVFSPIVSIDPGSYAPTAVTLCGWTTDDVRLRDDRVIPRKSFIVHDSIYEFDEINQNLARGSGRSPKEIAPRIRSMLIRNYANDTTLISDPAGGARVAGRLEPSIIQLYKQAGIPMRPAPRTRRVDGWTKMRELMRDGMFWVASRNSEWLDTVPGLPRSPHDAEDLDTDSVDHLADSTRYALLSQGTQIRSGNWK